MVKKRKLVAVLVFGTSKHALTADEEISLRHMSRHFGRYDKYFILPEGNPLTHPACTPVYFPVDNFGSVSAHCRFLFKTDLYQRFLEYEYVLIYHLDALVFRDELEVWCERGFDYIGAPVFSIFRDVEYPNGEKKRLYSLNGGFSLRRVEAHIQLLTEIRRYFQIPSYVRLDQPARNVFLSAAKVLFGNRYFRPKIPSISDKLWTYMSGFLMEDEFVSLSGIDYSSDFCLATEIDALGFAFDEAPREAFERAQGVLPFGGHAWPKHDRAFWQPYLLERD